MKLVIIVILIRRQEISHKRTCGMKNYIGGKTNKQTCFKEIEDKQKKKKIQIIPELIYLTHQKALPFS